MTAPHQHGTPDGPTRPDTLPSVDDVMRLAMEVAAINAMETADLSPVLRLRRAIEALHNALAEARQDTARLDELEALLKRTKRTIAFSWFKGEQSEWEAVPQYNIPAGFLYEDDGEVPQPTLRAAIDAATPTAAHQEEPK